ncbi:hypothetical protein VNO80_09055 [Phaseolus coccineus]|uniref:SET domain-containing protein n=1 Tax=Phaseolus coccineus TaxID=3886 RepID=A0AAN9N5H2_PHACN
MASSNSLLRMEQIPGKGRGLVVTQSLKACQILLTESLLILYSASPLFAPSFSPFTILSTFCDLTAQFLAKDRLNSFCLMDPYSPDGPQRFIKAYAIYPKATFFNHDCLPNA